ncbi:uncharacterized phage protein (TIGR02218 family) [Cereibacter ovatus]|uniref:Uncharacterized phage protein (TIGR02218 family) n=1 Tax=Cereibacter ovatus TaxID=439529 RepID=A0A285CNQ7_9RHOB|nr:DUF2163 domain-containing protein [Cereibacter ovatus]SNX69045.1 uncharacterized phage protein (TIGR02218 family) [Cereibacter ovatus]
MGAAEFHAHLKTGATTVCRCWAVSRRDGRVFGFTDHDLDLEFGGISFRARTGLSASALQQTTGLAVDNAEAVGALSDAAVTEEDLVAGRFDGAAVEAWLVNWVRVEDRILQFRGSLGEISHAGGSFRAELRGLTEALNQPQGRVFQRDCQAALGDRKCGFDVMREGYSAEAPVDEVEGGQTFRFAAFGDFAEGWFDHGRLVVLSGAAVGLVGVVKSDRLSAGVRILDLWQALGPGIRTGDLVRFEAGCDRRLDTCRVKFCNIKNFRGFPHVPGEDWLGAYPTSATRNDGGSLAK